MSVALMPSAPCAPLALHVTLRWRDDVIAFRRVAGDGVASVDALAPIPGVRAAGEDRAFARVVGGAAFAVAPAGGAASIRRAGGVVEIVEGPALVPLGAGDRVDVRLGDFRVEATADTPETLPRATRRATGVWAGIAVAAIAHGVAFGLAVQDARAGDTDEDERVSEIAGLLATAEQRARAIDPPIPDGRGAGEGRRENAKSGDGRAGGGAKAAGEAGAMGERDARPGEHRRYAVAEEVKQDPAPATSRADAVADARAFGMIGLLGGGSSAPAAAFADAWDHGADALSARGDLWAGQPGESWGMSGLALSGIGEGAGGRGEGIGLGRIGTLGHTDGMSGWGTGGDGSRGPSGVGWSSDRLGTYVMHARHRVRSYTCDGYRCSITGRLPPETIRRIVRLNHGRFRACYQQGLARNPELRGTVTTRFVIGHDGGVSSVADGGSTLPDPEVVACVVRTFYGLSFPPPEGGIVTVTYPIVCSPIE